ncbi:hypothetical protein FHW79_005191 [Azospirillum sp. OGB3]|uniref:hypothetical protein n=1 Tax=Azospirillum sp. OGB3 TaxID=2587012 RepID=UPI001606AEC8|nr:hypothetical protein [Azospirillum sp. OGB3]MBB3267530.1 hypothetical protein [Azospirillum sp. OGB3]
MAFRDLDQQQLDGYAAGRLTLDDLAAVAGISKQAVSAALRRRGIRRGASEASPATLAPAPPQNAPMTLPATPVTIPYEEQIEALAQHARITAGNAALGVLIEAEKLSRGESSHLGASALKAAAAAVAGSLDVLSRLGFLDDEHAELEAFDVNIMSEEQARAHQDALDQEEADPDDLEAPESTDDQDEPAPALQPADQTALRVQLQAIASAQGAAALRALAVRLGAPVGRTADALIASILQHAHRHPEALTAIMTAPTS